MCNECRPENWPVDLPHTGSEHDVHRKKDFIDRTLDNFNSFIVTALFSEKYARAKGLLQALDPRYKLITILLLVVTVSLVNRIEIILSLYILTVLLAYFSKINLSFFVKRVWLFIPLFSGIIIIPSIFNLVTPGVSLITFIPPGSNIGPWEFKAGLSITTTGLSGAFLFVTRVASSVSLVVLLTLTTKWSDVLCALQILHIPQAFVMTLSMAQRYIYLLLKLAEDMHLARRSRTIKPQNIKQNQTWVTSRMAQLLRRSYETSEQVHFAMISRGFDGKARKFSVFKARWPDFIWLTFSIILSVTVVWLI